ncbi:OmpA family protein [Fulvivirgaceae bacterium BMA10]|uniref:OmpA family protein n=1 Tax=Splendidivirga corallicola TaxID=3051826 RepID=A0ABT8KHE5_9BACT|nr:OmpA family protein [Fulvivirgaceae bacterium BMA10]
MKRIIFALIALTSISQINAQIARKVLPKTINITGRHQIAPSISGDGKTMIFLSTYSPSEQLELMYTYQTRPGVWATPESVTEVNKTSDYNYIRGFSLSYDGKTIYFSSRRGQGIGGYDIMFTEKKGGYWTPARNIGKPVNSGGHDGAPSVSPDGQTIYFMRCSQMNKNEAGGCELWVAQRRNKELWNEPTRLSGIINNGNASMPKILPDNKTLIFASDRSGKGGMDLFIAKNMDGVWSQPEPLYFLNTSSDDLFASVPAKGTEVYFSSKFRDFHNIMVSKLPEQFRPQKVVLMEGTAIDEVSGEPIKAFVQVYDANSQKRVQYARTSEHNGHFQMIFPVGDAYDFSVVSLDKEHFYYSKIYYKDSLDSSIKEKIEVPLKRIKPGLNFVSQNIVFEPNSAALRPESNLELRRLMKILKDHPNINLEIGIHTDEVLRDSIYREGLTEMSVDTVYLAQPEIPNYDTDSASTSVEMEEDSTFTTHSEESVTEAYELKYTYHNDRTQKQAETLLNYFIDKGVPPDRLSISGFGDSQPLTTNDTYGNRMKNRRIEIKLLD